MLTLIKREIQDHLLMFIIAAAVTTIFTCIVVYNVVLAIPSSPPIWVPEIMLYVLAWFTPFLLLVSAGLGATQMYSDRSKKISNFLITLATTRRRILAAKIIAGLLWILLAFMPLIAADIILLRLFPPMVPLDIIFPVKIVTTILLAALCCYTLGLQMGWQTNKRSAILGGTLIAPILLTVIIIKGFGVQTAIILLLFTVTMLIRTWQRFMSTAL